MGQYAPLEIEIRRLPNGAYDVELTCRNPRSTAQAPPARGRLSLDREALLACTFDADRYGRLLAEQLFPAEGDVRSKYLRDRAVVVSAGLDLRVCLTVHAGAEELHGLRWELLHDPHTGAPFATSERTPFSRFLLVDNQRPLPPRTGTARSVLVAVAAPPYQAECGVAKIDRDKEIAHVRNTLAANAEVRIEVLDPPVDVERLLDRLRGQTFDVLYLACHGLIVSGKPRLLLEGKEETSRRAEKWTDGQEIALGLQGLQAEKVPRLVVLASCESAGEGDGFVAESGESAQSTMVPRLADAGVPAVLAMQGKVRMDAVAEAMPVFFNELFKDTCGQVDRAMAVARSRLRRAGQRYDDHWMPNLYLCLKEGRLWQPETAPTRRVAATLPREILKRLPWRCDRSVQTKCLKAAYMKHCQGRKERPLVVLLRGHHEQAHDKFTERLWIETLPSFLRPGHEGEPVDRKGPLFYTDPGAGFSVDDRCTLLRGEIAHLICGDDTADAGRLAAEVADGQCPLIVEVAVNVTRQNPLPDLEVLKKWLRGLAAFPDVRQPLIFLVWFSWTDSGQKASPWFRFWKKNARHAIEELTGELKKLDGADLGVIELPLLDDVGPGDVDAWVTEHAAGVLEKIDDDLADDLRQKVRAFFAGREGLPMRPVGQNLRSQLENLVEREGAPT